MSMAWTSTSLLTAWAPSAEPVYWRPLATQNFCVLSTWLARSRNHGIQPMLPSDKAILVPGNRCNRPLKIHESMPPAGLIAPMDMLAMNGELDDTLYIVDDEPMWMDRTCSLSCAAAITGSQ